MLWNDATDLTIAVGDIHGCSAKLVALLKACTGYADERTTRFIFLGDNIDRGPDSRAVVQRLMTLQAGSDHPVICLRGNHEQMLEQAAFDPLQLLNWVTNGGDTTLDSYQVDHPRHIPDSHRKWLQSLPFFFNDGLRFFVHAGVDPFTPLDQQRDDILLWVRDEFPVDIDTGRFIVHGHTPQLSGKPELRRLSLNLDTGAFFGGPLTAAVFDQTRPKPLAFITDTGDITQVR